MACDRGWSGLSFVSDRRRTLPPRERTHGNGTARGRGDRQWRASRSSARPSSGSASLESGCDSGPELPIARTARGPGSQRSRRNDKARDDREREGMQKKTNARGPGHRPFELASIARLNNPWRHPSSPSSPLPSYVASPPTSPAWNLPFARGRSSSELLPVSTSSSSWAAENTSRARFRRICPRTTPVIRPPGRVPRYGRRPRPCRIWVRMEFDTSLNFHRARLRDCRHCGARARNHGQPLLRRPRLSFGLQGPGLSRAAPVHRGRHHSRASSCSSPPTSSARSPNRRASSRCSSSVSSCSSERS